VENSNNKFFDTTKIYKKKISFFVKEGLDSFLENIIKGLSDEYETKKIIVNNFNQIDEGMKWADICWFEWCDELVIYGSSHNLAKEKIIICRLHSYEAFTKYPADVIWENVDKIIFVAEHIKNFVINKFNIDNDKALVIPNGIQCEKWTFKERKTGFNIAYVGYINYKKGPMLLLHTFKAIYDKDNRYKLYIAGQFQDYRDILYFNQMIKEFNMKNNVIYEGWQDNLDKWLEDKNYILCTSILESQNISVMQAMAKGIKPIIHNFVGSKDIYPKNLIWNNIDDAVKMVTDNKYNSKEYNLYIKNNFDIKHQIDKIKHQILKAYKIEENIMLEQPLVTIGITNYNGKKYLSKCIDNCINQTYKNIEILLIYDFSNDGSCEIIKDYEKKYDNIHAIYHTFNSGGALKGIREIIDNSKGKYFQWIACDDYIEKDAIYKFVNYLEKNPQKDYVFSNFNIINEDNEKVDQWNYKIYSYNEAIKHIFKSASGIVPMNCLYRLEFFRNNKINWIVYRGNDFSADTLNFLQFIKYNWNYGKVDDTLINYRIHLNNLSHNLEKRINASVSIFDYIIKNFKEEIYMPEIPWDKVLNRKQFKNCIIAQFYYNQIQNHINMNAIPQYINANITREELIKYCIVFAKEGMNYIYEGLSQGDTYKIELLKLKDLYEKYIDEVKNLR
jgi:glycosyltransferase involved in cell wall biosynthesis